MRRRFVWTIAVLSALQICEAGNQPGQYIPHITPLKRTSGTSIDDYNSWRQAYMQIEESQTVGSDIELSGQELQANQIIMAAKNEEYEEGLETPHKFAPSKHLFEVLDKIKESKLFQIIAEMPKGGVLHAHDTALCSTDYLIEITYRKDLWGCVAGDNVKINSFKFSKASPKEKGKDCNWKLMTEIRKSKSAEKIDTNLRERLTLYPKTTYEDNNAVWRDFFGIFGLLDGLLFYAPVWGDYYYHALEEFYADGVQYLEFRSTLPILYDMEGKEYTAMDTVTIYEETLRKFMDQNPDFIGSKLIYAPLRHADDDQFDEYVRTCHQIKERYPTFVAGFDLVGQEEMGRPLKEFAPKLLAMNDNIDFFFHAGETNWYGSTVDENLIDAVLLGTKRIGHGFAVMKHPIVLQMLKENKIAVELNPISNQVLQLVKDLRNHPGAFLFADDYPVVVSSDDPSFWKATPLSHDFYVAFLGIASAHADLRLLKKLALNSIYYSGMNPSEKQVALTKWQAKWDVFINQIVRGNSFHSRAKRLQTNRID